MTPSMIDVLDPLEPATEARDIERGMAWWNARTPEERRRWLRVAGTKCAADAWAAYKAYWALRNTARAS